VISDEIESISIKNDSISTAIAAFLIAIEEFYSRSSQFNHKRGDLFAIASIASNFEKKTWLLGEYDLKCLLKKTAGLKNKKRNR